jgi:hypothetical protein
MEWPSRDRFGRTTKLLVDSGQASNPAHAEEILRGYVLQIVVHAEAEFDEPSQAALLTAVNAGRRAFKGGVKVRLDRGDAEISIPWGRGLTVEQAVTAYGGELVPVVNSNVPTLVIGGESPSIDAPVLHLGWRGWVGFAEPTGFSSTRSRGMVLAGVVAAALGVSEMFQYCQGAVGPGDRAVGLSLWSPSSDWRERFDGEPQLEYLPSALWILGLGHLGQASIWALGCLPYRLAEPPTLHLMDTDTFVSANLDTGLLAGSDSIGQKKTRVAMQRLEAVGIESAIVERVFDGTVRPTATEPIVALAGFDNAEARRLVESSFAMTVDAGLGAGPNDYLDVLIHEFPSEVKAVDAFPSRTRPPGELGRAYEAEIARQVAEGVPEPEARCGIVEAAGATVGAAFVGAVAGALSVAAVLRQLHGGPHYSVTSLNLEEPEFSSAVLNDDPSWSDRNPGFLRCDRTEGSSVVA